MPLSFSCEWDVEIPNSRVPVPTVNRCDQFTCRDGAASYLRTTLCDVINAACVPYDDGVLYHWLLSRPINVSCVTTVKQGGAVASALDPIILDRAREYFPKLVFEPVNARVSSFGGAIMEHGMRISGDISTYTAFYWTQLLLRAAVHSASVSSFKDNSWLYGQYGTEKIRGFEQFMYSMVDDTVRAAAWQICQMSGPMDMQYVMSSVSDDTNIKIYTSLPTKLQQKEVDRINTYLAGKS